MKRLQAPAIQPAAEKMTASERHAAGYGGSYVQDLRGAGTFELQEATQGSSVSLKHPDAPRSRPADTAAAGSEE